MTKLHAAATLLTGWNSTIGSDRRSTDDRREKDVINFGVMESAFLIPNDSFRTKPKTIAVVVGVVRADVMKIDRLNTGVDQRQQLVGLRNAIVIGIDPKTIMGGRSTGETRVVTSARYLLALPVHQEPGMLSTWLDRISDPHYHASCGDNDVGVVIINRETRNCASVTASIRPVVNARL